MICALKEGWETKYLTWILCSVLPQLFRMSQCRMGWDEERWQSHSRERGWGRGQQYRAEGGAMCSAGFY